jgi:hypothetical protein
MTAEPTLTVTLALSGTRWAEIVIPQNLTRDEALRLAGIVATLGIPKKGSDPC